MKFYFGSDSHVVHDKLIESALMKLMNNLEAHITSYERDAVNSTGNTFVVDEHRATSRAKAC